MANYCTRGGRHWHCAIPFSFEMQKQCEFYVEDGRARGCTYRETQGRHHVCLCEAAKATAHVRGESWSPSIAAQAEADRRDAGPKVYALKDGKLVRVVATNESEVAHA